MTKSNYIKKLKKEFDKALEAFAQDVSVQIENAYEETIQNFYDDYDPRWYNRTYSTFLASSGYNGLFDDFYDNDGYRAGITVDSKNIPGSPYRADKDWVFNRTFYHGIHGISLMDMRKNSKEYGWNMIREARSKYKTYNKIYHSTKNINGHLLHGLRVGLRTATANYKPFISASGRYVKVADLSKHFSSKNKSSMKPKNAMDRRFKQISSKENLDKLSEEYIQKVLDKMTDV